MEEVDLEQKIKELQDWFASEIMKLQKQIDEIKDKMREDNYGL
jgi:hypothetical protein